MRRTAVSLLVVICAVAATAAACASSGKNGSAAGTWVGNLPAADAAGRNVRLELRTDGTATMTTGYLGRGAPIADEGTWRQDKNELKFQIEGAGGKKSGEPMTWERKDASLVPKSWDKSRYGSGGLPMTLAPEDAPR